MSSTLEASVFMGKKLLGKFTLHQKDREQSHNETDVSEKLTLEQSDEIFGVSPINWEDSAWRQLSLVNDEEVISLSHVMSFQILCCALEK